MREKEQYVKDRHITLQLQVFMTGNSGEDVGRSQLLVWMKFKDSGRRNAALKRWKRDRSAAYSRVRIFE